MSSSELSVFDLSPSEKLQLVEDLWDDLAATPEDVPVHDWQKQELARRRANLLKNPAAGLAWQELKRRVREQHVARSGQMASTFRLIRARRDTSR
ncbi:MAG TPA: addiction module protein [Terracidiphilus sp.]|nr:addiction module protein [Terracidiphilus sp.]